MGPVVVCERASFYVTLWGSASTQKDIELISDNPAFDAFVSEHRWAALTTLSSSGEPVTSMVAYARDGDSLVVSTPGGTFKRASIERNPNVNLCVITNQEPFNFVAIRGVAVIETDRLVENTRKVFANIVGTGFDEPEDLDGWLSSQARVIIRVTPQRVHGVIR